MFSARDPVSPDQGQIKGAVALNGNGSIFLSGLSIVFSTGRRSPACCQSGHYSRRVLTAFYGLVVGCRPLSKGIFVVKWLQMKSAFERGGRWRLVRSRFKQVKGSNAFQVKALNRRRTVMTCLFMGRRFVGGLVLFRNRTYFIPMDLLLFRKFLKFC